MPREPIALHDIASYEAAQARDGTWTVFDVEIFAAFRDVRDPGDVLEWTEERLHRIIERHESRAREGYLAPVHFGHHPRSEDAPPPPHICRFLPRSVETRTYEGRPLRVLVGDLIGIPPAEYAQMKEGRFPGRSVEISPTEPEIRSLALLADEPPFLRFPLLIPRERDQGARTPEMGAYAAPVEVVHFSLRGMTRETDPMAGQNATSPATQPPAQYMGGEKDDPETPEEYEAPKDIGAAILALKQALAALEALQGATAPADPTPGPVEMSAYGREKPASFAAGGVEDARHLAMRDEVQRMYRETMALRTELRQERAIRDAETRLHNAGASPDRQKLEDLYRRSPGHLEAYIETVLEYRSDMPPAWTGEMPEKRAPLPADIASFAADAPPAQKESIAKAARAYEAMPASLRRSISRESFVRANAHNGASILGDDRGASR